MSNYWKSLFNEMTGVLYLILAAEIKELKLWSWLAVGIMIVGVSKIFLGVSHYMAKTRKDTNDE